MWVYSSWGMFGDHVFRKIKYLHTDYRLEEHYQPFITKNDAPA